jgi:hypothetical protein
MTKKYQNTREIRGLKAGSYLSDDNSLLCRIHKNDYSITIEFADFDGNLFYAVHIDENQEADFEVGAIHEILVNDEDVENDTDVDDIESEEDYGQN